MDNIISSASTYVLVYSSESDMPMALLQGVRVMVVQGKSLRLELGLELISYYLA